MLLTDRFTYLFYALTSAILVCLFCVAGTASAANYGEGKYGKCTYGKCAAITQTETLPDGAKVIINLQDGQIIPASGYLIKITALSGKVSTFKSATISINGTQAAVIEPDETGTASWRWDPKEFPGTQITIIITALDGTTTSQTYTVALATPTSPVTNSGTNTPRSDRSPQPSHGFTEILSDAVPETVKQAFRKLPPVVVNTFPYVLFVVLALVAIVVLLQIQRELLASRKLSDAVEQQKIMLELKKNFLGLASHYLRTPLTIISGAIGMISDNVNVTAEMLAQIKASSTKLSDHTKAIVRDQETVATPVSQGISNPDHTGIRVGIWVVIAAIAIGSAAFNILAYASGRELPKLNLITQVGGFVLISLVLYQIDRRFVLRRRERKAQDDLLALQKQLQDSQDTFLEQTATVLYTDYAELKNLTAKIPVDATTKIMHDGIDQLYGVISKCQTAQQLKGAYSDQPLTPVNLADVLNYSDPKLSQLIDAKKLQVVTPANMQVTLREPTLLQSVIRSLIDNAAAYSSEQGKITLEANDNGQQLDLSVNDEGKGITKGRQQLLFQPLSKIEGYEDFSHEGMGFSLYLDKLIMEYLGGSIGLESEENKGTKVRLQVPLAV